MASSEFSEEKELPDEKEELLNGVQAETGKNVLLSLLNAFPALLLEDNVTAKNIETELHAEIAKQEARLQSLENFSCRLDASIAEEEGRPSPDLEYILEKEKTLNLQLDEIEKEEESVLETVNDVEVQCAVIDGVEKHYWRIFNRYESRVRSINGEVESFAGRREIVEDKLRVLQTINVLNDCFHIWYDGPYGTINGLRLGKLDQSVGWEEINAAWGQAALAISSIAKERKFTFGMFRIIPQGSYSKIAKIGEEKSKSYELYTNGGFWNRRRFDIAMHWFLLCVHEIGVFAETNDRTMKLPYEIKGDRIAGISVKITVSSLENWTRALKHLLMNLKWLIVWCSKQRY
mmetsp:Transcript_1574/g.1854  ORF Transcript_1574/g.1854 Transcript_1574/m.1854 type:complete len:347 (-) Transcript_1574:54-1094(-)